MAHIILKNGREFYTQEPLEYWKKINEMPQFLIVDWIEVDKRTWDDFHKETKLIVNKDHISEINQ